MKKRLIVLGIVLTFILMLPVIAQAETKEEFELMCSLKTASSCEVHQDSIDGPVIASLPAGTYVKIKGRVDDNLVRIQFWYNGGKMAGWAYVKLNAALSNVRNGNGTLDQVHELDPDYDAKMQQGTVERDVKAGWTSYENDPLGSDLEHVSPEEAATRAGQYKGSASSQYALSQQKAVTGSTAATDASAASVSARSPCAPSCAA